MDFSNYTIGRIVKNGHSYSNPPDKQKVRRQIYWRIFELGWDAKLFIEAETALANDNYFSRGRTEQATVERYGKKYSWIAFYENAGLRNDLGLLDRDWRGFKFTDADIDPSFPEKPISEVFFTHNLLGDKSTPLIDWFENGGMPFVELYLTKKDLKGKNGEWICLDSYIGQEDMSIERNQFTFIRGFIVKEDDYTSVIKQLNLQNMGGRWLPEKQENYYTYAGELYYFDEATYDNYTNLEFEIGKKIIKIQKGEPDYYPSVFFEFEGDNVSTREEFPDVIEKEVSEIVAFDTLMPVMEYNWEGHHSVTNNAGHITIVSKEIAKHLKLASQTQTFDLLDSNGNIASLNFEYNFNYNNSHRFVYIRKDLIDRYLEETKSKFVWVIWGERDVRFKTEERRQEFFRANPFKGNQVFQKVVEYGF